MARKKIQYEYVESLGRYRKRVKDSNGKYKAIYGNTPQELSVKIEQFLNAQECVLNDASNPFVKDYIDRWNDLKKLSRAYRTHTQLKYVVDKHITPYIGEYRIKEVTKKIAKESLAHLDNCSADYARKIYGLYKRIFDNAVIDGLININPYDNIKISPRRTESKVKALSSEQQEKLLSSIAGTKAYVFCMIALYTGMRCEEICGLEWSAIHFDNVPYIEVKQVARWYHKQTEINGILKSDSAKRNIPIPQCLVDCLLPIKKSSGFILFDETPCRASYERIWYDVRKYLPECKTKMYDKFDFRVTPHVLRHTYITNLILGGANLKRVQYLAGHSRINITMDIYTHLMENKPNDLIDDINLVFGK